MIPVKFEQANKVYTAPAGMTVEQCGDLHAYKGEMHDGQQVVISCFQLTQEELDEVKRTGKVWLWVFGAGMPPVAVDTKNPWRTT